MRIFDCNVYLNTCISSEKAVDWILVELDHS